MCSDRENFEERDIVIIAIKVPTGVARECSGTREATSAAANEDGRRGPSLKTR